MATLFDSDPDRNGGAEQGEARKQFAHAILEANRESFVIDARRSLLQHLLEHGTGTINDVRRAVSIPIGINPKVMGCVPNALAKAGIIRCVDQEKTDRAIAHARKVSIWAIADHSKAVAWLAAHAVPISAKQGGGT